eukprot:TRINITY_DN12529_c0_g3_i1.p1 TRINITY_DN12529_c0_g3~~TRINITY_DN12529_c0_g3_i1.p1  ORF type:complete len:347 (+),score=68.90 TRINITY_DN12529_c0_g3_i1:104-1144(+)
MWKVICADAGLRIREGPSIESAVVGMLEHAECIVQRDQTQDWVQHSRGGWSMLFDDFGPCSRKVHPSLVPGTRQCAQEVEMARVAVAMQTVSADPEGENLASACLDMVGGLIVGMFGAHHLALLSRSCRFLYHLATLPELPGWRSLRIFAGLAVEDAQTISKLLRLPRFARLQHVACQLAYRASDDGVLGSLTAVTGRWLRSFELQREGPMWCTPGQLWEDGLSGLLLGLPLLEQLKLSGLYSVRLHRCLAHLPPGLQYLELDSCDLFNGKILSTSNMYVQRCNLTHLIITRCDSCVLDLACLRTYLDSQSAANLQTLWVDCGYHWGAAQHNNNCLLYTSPSPRDS